MASQATNGSKTLRWLHRIYWYYSAVSHWLMQRLTPAGWLVVMVLPIAACMGMDTNQVSTYQAFTFLSVVAVIALFMGRFSQPRVGLTRDLPRFGTVGEPLSYWIKIHNLEKRQQKSLVVMEDIADPRPSFADFSAHPEPGEALRNGVDRFFRFYRWTWLMRQNSLAKLEAVPVPDLAVNGRVEVLMRLEPQQRGILRLDGISVACPEPFGLYRTPVKTADSATVLILPKRYRLPAFTLPGSVRYQQGGVAQAASVGESEEFSSLREYRRGDPLSRIHWKSWAKTGKPIVKEFQQEYFARHALVLDTYVGDGAQAVFEEAVSLAASFASTVDTRESLLDLLFVETKAHCFTAGHGVGQAEQMLEILATVQPCANQPFSALERLVCGHAGSVGGCICIFVGWDEHRIALVKCLQALSIPLMIYVIGAPGDASVAPELGRGDSFCQLVSGQIESGLARI